MSCWRWVLLWVFPFGAAHSRWQSGTLRSDAGDELGVFRVLDVVFRVKSHELSQPINLIHVRTPSQLQARSWLLVFLMMRNEVNTLPVYVWNGGTSTSTLSPPNTFNCFFPINLYADCVEEIKSFLLLHVGEVMLPPDQPRNEEEKDVKVLMWTKMFVKPTAEHF